MAETSVAVQPAGQAPAGAPAPAPLPLKMVALPDGTQTETQGMTLYDDQGRPVQLLTREQGEQIIKLLTQLVTMTAIYYGGFLPDDNAAGLSNPG